jgi:hypothetical protein
VDARDQRAESDPLSLRRREGQGGPGLEHGLLRDPHHADLEEVVHHPQAVQASLVSLARKPAERRPDVGLVAAVAEAGKLDPDAHEGPSR